MHSRSIGADPRSSSRIWLGTIAVFVVSLAFLLPFYLRQPTFFDADSYFHLAVARAYAEKGFFADLDWARFSLMANGFGDKELLFHILLVPFVALGDPLVGGRVTLALLNAAIAGALAHLGIRAIGIWGALLPFFLFLTSVDWLWRVARLRAELLFLLLLLIALALIAARRYRWLAMIAALCALGYTAFQAFLGLCLLIFLYRGWVRSQWAWQLPLYALLGVVVGLLVHPHFPDNLVVWAAQNLAFFHFKESLDVGVEIFSEPADELLLFNLGWWLGLLLIISVARKVESSRTEKGWTDAFGVAAVVFGLLFVLMLRFSLYFVPFLTLALLFWLRDNGYRLSSWIATPGRPRLPAVVGLLLCLLASFPQLRRAVASLHAEELDSRERLWTELEDVLPSEAKVAATWSDAHVYTFFAPQASYLNVLDPVFMAMPFPAQYELQRRVFDGREPDVSFALQTRLDSDYLAYTPAESAPLLLRRLASDPRVEELHGAPDYVFLLGADAGDAFILDWQLVDSTGELVGTYPRATDGRERAVEGYVDANRLRSRDACLRFAHRLETEAATERQFEFAPYGPSSLWLNGRGIVRVAGDLRAVLGEGLLLPIELPAGENTFVVETCRATGTPEYAGFYLVERGRRDASPSEPEPRPPPR